MKKKQDKEKKQVLATSLKKLENRSIIVVVFGPEGGLTEQEVKQA